LSSFYLILMPRLHLAVLTTRNETWISCLQYEGSFLSTSQTNIARVWQQEINFW